MCLNETYSGNFLGKHLSAPLLFNFALEFAITKVQENRAGLNHLRAHQLLVYAHDVTLLGDNIDNVKNSTKLMLVRRLV
jgi:hypothetical protein